MVKIWVNSGKHTPNASRFEVFQMTCGTKHTPNAPRFEVSQATCGTKHCQGAVL